eukprot:2436526-Rhodomonas_salina.2
MPERSASASSCRAALVGGQPLIPRSCRAWCSTNGPHLGLQTLNLPTEAKLYVGGAENALPRNGSRSPFGPARGEMVSPSVQ